MDKDKYCTPQWVLEPVYEFYDGEIDLDPCSGPGSIVKASQTFSEHSNGLEHDWAFYRKVFCNPPYSKPNLGLWSNKCARMGNQDRWETEILLLVPAYTSAKWFQNNVFPTCTSILFYNKRISFLYDSKPTGSPSFHSVLVYWGSRAREFSETFSEYGWIVSP